ncbi:uncharacterized protein L969DRAFT_49617 [Mixia osmundae IAM 14324]|uniref:Uncharacterized protein n=1 Tax=Mixia osmundae (strain CBS 9802 / IAM 14324 / JCM 22182 / KY 12970) TaxID=764103 RepID=G7DVS5_MIXOS|nr:uncharacterized protein L969DRAFT_49617 [Mixia osmundae IAM 14324]KEI39634.1 hypothetical protein L969DRAFT_49617 [Mixia osmundae IAM 14324]GAA94685.1 hypothetical protein E5Q_01338 [Mixia osmundae IAM 14324]
MGQAEALNVISAFAASLRTAIAKAEGMPRGTQLPVMQSISWPQEPLAKITRQHAWLVNEVQEQILNSLGPGMHIVSTSARGGGPFVGSGIAINYIDDAGKETYHGGSLSEPKETNIDVAELKAVLKTLTIVLDGELKAPTVSWTLFSESRAVLTALHNIFKELEHSDQGPSLAAHFICGAKYREVATDSRMVDQLAESAIRG